MISTPLLGEIEQVKAAVQALAGAIGASPLVLANAATTLSETADHPSPTSNNAYATTPPGVDPKNNKAPSRRSISFSLSPVYSRPPPQEVSSEAAKDSTNKTKADSISTKESVPLGENIIDGINKNNLITECANDDDTRDEGDNMHDKMAVSETVARRSSQQLSGNVVEEAYDRDQPSAWTPLADRPSNDVASARRLSGSYSAVRQPSASFLDSKSSSAAPVPVRVESVNVQNSSASNDTRIEETVGNSGAAKMFSSVGSNDDGRSSRPSESNASNDYVLSLQEVPVRADADGRKSSESAATPAPTGLEQMRSPEECTANDKSSTDARNDGEPCNGPGTMVTRVDQTSLKERKNDGNLRLGSVDAVRKVEHEPITATDDTSGKKEIPQDSDGFGDPKKGTRFSVGGSNIIPVSAPIETVDGVGALAYDEASEGRAAEDGNGSTGGGTSPVEGKTTEGERPSKVMTTSDEEHHSGAERQDSSSGGAGAAGVDDSVRHPLDTIGPSEHSERRVSIR